MLDSRYNCPSEQSDGRLLSRILIYVYVPYKIACLMNDLRSGLG
jgi:hypothetical protein